MKIIQQWENAFPSGLIDNVVSWMNNTEMVDVDCAIQNGVLTCDLNKSNEFLYPSFKEIVLRYAKDYFSKFSPLPYDLHLEHIDIFRYPPNTYCKEHCGAEFVKDGDYNQVRLLIMMLFLNDNYDGGELYFSDQDVTVTPKKGTLVAFPSSFMVPHGVHEVKNGTRDMMGFNFAITEACGTEGPAW